MLWTVTWAMWGSYCVYLTAFLTAQLGSNRYIVFGILLCFSWVTYGWNWVFLLGYLIQDMRVRGIIGPIQKTTRRLITQVVVLVLAFGVVWIVPVRKALDNGLASIQIYDNRLVGKSSSLCHALSSWLTITLANMNNADFVRQYRVYILSPHLFRDQSQ